MRKRIVSLLLAVCMVVSLLPVAGLSPRAKTAPPLRPGRQRRL